jgi:formylmethanofuran dehydrogenase subunit E
LIVLFKKPFYYFTVFGHSFGPSLALKTMKKITLSMNIMNLQYYIGLLNIIIIYNICSFLEGLFLSEVKNVNTIEPAGEKVFDIEDYIHRVQSFHGHVAPGVVIAGFMVHLARSRMPEGVLFDAISETPVCLPDAVQLLTPCTVGNGWLKIINLGRFALSLYDKHHGNGVRVFLAPVKLEQWPEIKAWFLKLKSRKEQNHEDILSQIKQAGVDICGVHPVQIKPEFLKKRDKGKIAICPSCAEAYPLKDGSICLACQGNSPYVIPDVP